MRGLKWSGAAAHTHETCSPRAILGNPNELLHGPLEVAERRQPHRVSVLVRPDRAAGPDTARKAVVTHVFIFVVQAPPLRPEAGFARCRKDFGSLEFTGRTRYQSATLACYADSNCVVFAGAEHAPCHRPRPAGENAALQCNFPTRK